MESHAKAKEEFTRKLEELKKKAQPDLYEHNFNDLVIYEKLLELQEQLNKLAGKIGKG